jgi:acetyl-CoA carboxylase biotin carboxyl carrier protein
MTQTTIRSEIAGTVWRIEAQEGEAIAADDPILILESMKMEIPVLAPETGKLLRILVKRGDDVREGQDLATLDVG